jgi:predicted  nucleic acid-binding Zn-ribbon protein
MIDLDEARKLVHALEQDLDKAQRDSKDAPADLQPLREEVEALRRVLQEQDPGHDWVREALEKLQGTIGEGLEEARLDAIVASRYVAAIGKMLGL